MSPLPSPTLLARKHNAHHPPLLKLPIELLLMITAHLNNNTDVLSTMLLRATSVIFAQILPSPLPSLPYAFQRNAQRQKYKAFVRSRVLHALNARELARPSRLPAGHLVCAGCVASHPSPLFYPFQRAQRPEDRICRGREGALDYFGYGCTFAVVQSGGRQIWICTHGARSKEGEVGWRRIGPEWEGERGYCLGPGSVVDAFWGLGKRKRDVKVEKERAEDLVLRLDFVLLQCPPLEAISGNRVRELIPSAIFSKSGLCPHLSVSIVQKLLARHPYQDCANRSTHGIIPRPCPWPSQQRKPVPWLSLGKYINRAKTNKDRHCGRTHHCPNPSCSTQFSLYRARLPPTSTNSQPQNELLLTVVRNLGPVTDPTDPRWIAQLTEPTRPSGILWDLHNCPPRCCEEKQRIIERCFPGRRKEGLVERVPMWGLPCCGVMLPCCVMQKPPCAWMRVDADADDTNGMPVKESDMEIWGREVVNLGDRSRSDLCSNMAVVGRPRRSRWGILGWKWQARDRSGFGQGSRQGNPVGPRVETNLEEHKSDGGTPTIGVDLATWRKEHWGIGEDIGTP